MKRHWHGRWLERIVPELKLTWWKYGSPPDEERERLEKGVASELAKAAAYLRDPANAAAIRDGMDRINWQAGLPVEGGRRFDEEIAENLRKRTISLSVEKGPFVTGRQIRFRISYRNGGTAPWKRFRPDASFSDMLLSLRMQPKRELRAQRFASSAADIHAVADSGDAEGVRYPACGTISIAPGGSFDFEVAWPRRDKRFAFPAVYTLWVESDGEKIESNRIEIPVRFTAESVAACLARARDKERLSDERWYCGRWLGKVVPGFEAKWEFYDDTPGEDRARMDKELEQKLARAEAYLKDPRNAKAIQEAIDRINRDAGLPAGPGGGANHE